MRQVETARGKKNGSAGFTYIFVMVLVVVAGISASRAATYWGTLVKREKEEELLFRGDQIRKGIEAYYKWTAQKHGGTGIYPESLEELLKSKFSASPKRFLRKVYNDPFTGKPDWVLLNDPVSKRVMGVRSSSGEKPLKTDNFPQNYIEFSGKTSYSDWTFVYNAAAPQAGQVKK